MEINETSNGRMLLVTGATGHTGRRAARRLAEAGWRLRCVTRDVARAREILPRGVELIEGSLDEPEGLIEAGRGCDAFLNMAHVGFADKVVQVCKGAGIGRVVSLSSTRRFTQWPEDSARRVIAGEAALEASGLNWTVLRAAMIYGGPEDNNLERVAEHLRRGRPLPLVRGGRNLVQPIFVWDLVDAIERALAGGEAVARRALTVAGAVAVPQKFLIEQLGTAIRRPPVWIPAPYWMVLGGAWVLERVMRRPKITCNQIMRLQEDKAFDITEAREALGGWQPRDYIVAFRMKAEGKA